MKDEHQQISEDEVLRMASQILEGVCYLHKNLVVHRDLKPSNIFMTESHDLIIGDFGLSKAIDYKS